MARSAAVTVVGPSREACSTCGRRGTDRSGSPGRAEDVEVCPLVAPADLVRLASHGPGRAGVVQCPTCDRRCAVLYAGYSPGFRCRIFQGLTYTTSRMSKWDRQESGPSVLNLTDTDRDGKPHGR